MIEVDYHYHPSTSKDDNKIYIEILRDSRNFKYEKNCLTAWDDRKYEDDGKKHDIRCIFKPIELIKPEEYKIFKEAFDLPKSPERLAKITNLVKDGWKDESEPLTKEYICGMRILLILATRDDDLEVINILFDSPFVKIYGLIYMEDLLELTHHLGILKVRWRILTFSKECYGITLQDYTTWLDKDLILCC